MRIGIFGGSFNPPHMGHAAAIGTALRALALDLLLVVPAAQPPHKALPEGSPPPGERLVMARLAFGDIPKVVVSDMELRRGGCSYTYDTVMALRKEYPGAEFFLITGGDMFLSLRGWYRARELLRVCVPAVMARTGGQLAEIERYADGLRKEYGADIRILPHEFIEISSTDLRAGREGGFLPERVREYIEEKGIYKTARYPFEVFREYNRAHLSPKRLAHVLGCEQEAVRLARRWGADEDDARAAALLHDITKELDLPAQLKLCGEYDIVLDNVEKTAPKLLHAKTAAALAGALFHVPERVCEAIKWHTTGKADMNLLEKVLFLADYTEPARDFPGVEGIRKLALENLDGAMILGLRLTADEVAGRGQTLHVKSIETLDWLLKRDN